MEILAEKDQIVPRYLGLRCLRISTGAASLIASPMSISLLQELSETPLPLTINGGEIVDAVHILLLAGHVQAEVAKAVRTPSGWMNPTATVTAITRSGLRMLRLFPNKSGSRKRISQKD